MPFGGVGREKEVEEVSKEGGRKERGDSTSIVERMKKTYLVPLPAKPAAARAIIHGDGDDSGAAAPCLGAAAAAWAGPRGGIELMGES